MRLTFPCEKTRQLLEHAESAPDRRPTLEQIVTPEFWREDMDPERRAVLMEEVERDGFAFSASSGDVDKAKIPSGLILVGDQGVYLMSNGLPGLPQGENVAYANEVNPREMEFDDWWEAKRQSFGGDDGTVPIPADAIRAFLREGRDLVMNVTPDSIGFVADETLSNPVERYWIVPIRYWEHEDLDTIDVSEVSERHVYGFHNRYGDNVYIDVDRAFKTPEEALDETLRLRGEYEAELDEDVQHWDFEEIESN